MSSAATNLKDYEEMIERNILRLKPMLIREDGSRNHRIAQELSLMKFMKQVIEENHEFFLDELDQYRMFNSKKA